MRIQGFDIVLQKNFALSLYIDRYEKRGANQLFSDPAWGTEQDSPD